MNDELVLRAQIVLRANDLPPGVAVAMLADATGAALLVLLCNAKAKEPGREGLYAHKSALLRQAVLLARFTDVCWKPHVNYGECYVADRLILLETKIGQLAFHVKAGDPVLSLIAEGTDPWRGERMQPHARRLAEEWIAAAQPYAR